MRLLWAVAVWAVAACGPIRLTGALAEADAELAAARAAGAERSATFEFASAEAYLHKAREVAGHASYERATELALLAKDFASRARKKAAAASNRVQEDN